MMRSLPVLIVASFLLAAPPVRAIDVDPEVLQAQAKRAAVMAEARSKTVCIFPPTGEGGGSGVLITPDGYALSNYHVVNGSEKHMKCGLSDGRAYDAVVVGIDPVGDVALIKLFGRDDFPVAEMADSDAVRVGDWVFASGNPFLLAHDFQPTVTYGIVSGVHRYQFPAGTLLEYTDCLQTDASINPGNSGGPLFDADGRLIGINGRGSFEKRGRVNVGVGYAISINQIKHFLGSLRSGRIVDHATLGARVASDADGRAVVSDVLEESDAFRRGLRIGDEVVAFGGRPVLTANAFKNVLGIFPQGYRVPLTYRSRGTTHQTMVRLAGVHNPEELLAKMRGGKMPKDHLPPRPKPGDAPDDGPEPEKKSDPEKNPGNLPNEPKFKLPFGKQAADDAGPKIPEIVTKHYAERNGYANYFFNELERDRVWRSLSTGNDFSSDGVWTITGDQLAGGAPVAKTGVEIRIGDDRVEYRLPTGAAVLPLTDDLSAATEPTGTGGLLAALSLWRRLLILGPKKFGDVTYLGTFPLREPQPVYDVLLARHGGVTCRYYVDGKNGELAGLEMQLSDDVDPCELVFADYAEQQGRRLPRRIEVRHGDQIYTFIVPTTWNFNANK
jgi:serine protease Do